MKYRIKWLSKETGKTGKSSPAFSTRELAKRQAVMLDRQWPSLSHSVESVNEKEVMPTSNA